ncbi:hypothetical protein RJ641_012903 [Dillenia turbinata]|uniref:Uncharacterized protein n=1 Tax=Dillenia turbinata TaxID=194707 RepID=A0AAN8Z2N8_9MAGN
MHKQNPQFVCNTGNGTLYTCHPSSNELRGLSRNISDSILVKLRGTVESLEEEKTKRLEKLHHLGKALTNSWNLMDTPDKDCWKFSHVANLLSISSAEVSNPGSLTAHVIQQIELEEEICYRTHMEIPSRSKMDYIINLINNGLGRTDIKSNRRSFQQTSYYGKGGKWMLVREAEHWLEEYNRDENRYSVRREAHKNQKRTQRARIIAHKLPALMDLLMVKTKDWEEERKKTSLYDEEMKKIQNQVVQPENLFWSRPGTSNRGILNGGFSNAVPVNRRPSLCLEQLESKSISSDSESISFIKEEKKARRPKIVSRSHLASHPRDETTSFSPFSGLEI